MFVPHFIFFPFAFLPSLSFFLFFLFLSLFLLFVQQKAKNNVILVTKGIYLKKKLKTRIDGEPMTPLN